MAAMSVSAVNALTEERKKKYPSKGNVFKLQISPEINI